MAIAERKTVLHVRPRECSCCLEFETVDVTEGEAYAQFISSLNVSADKLELAIELWKGVYPHGVVKRHDVTVN